MRLRVTDRAGVPSGRVVSLEIPLLVLLLCCLIVPSEQRLDLLHCRRTQRTQAPTGVLQAKRPCRLAVAEACWLHRPSLARGQGSPNRHRGSVWLLFG